MQDKLDGQVELVFGESFGCATAGTLFHRQRVRVTSLILSGPQYMSLGIFNGFVTNVIPRNQYRLLGKIQGQKKLPLLLKLYTRTDDDKLLRQFEAMPSRISLETLRNCAREGLRLYEEIDRYDGVVIDRLWVGHSRFWLLPGCEDIPYVQTWAQVLKKRTLLTLIWIVGAAIVAEIVVTL